MGRPAKTLAPPASKSLERMELERIASGISETASVDSWQNANGFCLVVELPQGDVRSHRVHRFYVEGGATPGACEAVCLAALRAMSGGRS